MQRALAPVCDRNLPCGVLRPPLHPLHTTAGKCEQRCCGCCVSALLTAGTKVTLLLPRSFTLPKQDSAISRSSQKQLPSELKAETQNAAQTGKSSYEKTRQCSGYPASSQLLKSSHFCNTCSQYSGPPLPKEQLSSTWKVQAYASPSR